MRLPRDVSGHRLAAQLCKELGFKEVRQRGSHLTLETHGPQRLRIQVPLHRQLKTGMLAQLLKQVAAHLDLSIADLVAKLDL